MQDWRQRFDPVKSFFPPSFFWLNKSSKLLDMPEEAKKELLSANKASSSLPKIIKTGYNALDLIYFFTSGEDEVKCWTIRVRSYITACYWVPILISFPLFTVARHKSPTGCWFVLSLLLFVTYSPHKNVGTIHTDFYHGFVCAEGTYTTSPQLNTMFRRQLTEPLPQLWNT